MKKVVSLILSLIMCVALVSCGGKEKTNNPASSDTDTIATESTKSTRTDTMIHKLGEPVETDIIRITLNAAELTIAVENTHGDDYFLPKEYDLQEDSRNPFVAAKGHTLVAITYKADNLDRASVDLDNSFNGQFITIKYAENTYTASTKYGYASKNGWDWELYTSSNVLLLAGETKILRCYIDIPVNAENLNDDFILTFTLPNSDGNTTDFSYLVTAKDREVINNQEIILEEAIATFTKEKSQEYFANHLNDFVSLSSDEIAQIITQKSKWNIVIKYDYGNWTGKFEFEDSGKIKETIYDGSTGYFNNRTWKVTENSIILSGEDICEVKKVIDGVYLLVKDGYPYLLMQ